MVGRIDDEIARRQPQFVHAAVDLLGKIADILQSLQLGKGRTDVADGDHGYSFQFLKWFLFR